MKYALLINEVPDYNVEFEDALRESITAEYATAGQHPAVYGGAQLQPATAATTVRGDGEKPLHVDGPFADTKEILAGYYLVDCDLDTALELAATLPARRYGGSVEVRPIRGFER